MALHGPTHTWPSCAAASARWIRVGVPKARRRQAAILRVVLVFACPCTCACLSRRGAGQAPYSLERPGCSTDRLTSQQMACGAPSATPSPAALRSTSCARWLTSCCPCCPPTTPRRPLCAPRSCRLPRCAPMHSRSGRRRRQWRGEARWGSLTRGWWQWRPARLRGCGSCWVRAGPPPAAGFVRLFCTLVHLAVLCPSPLNFLLHAACQPAVSLLLLHRHVSAARPGHGDRPRGRHRRRCATGAARAARAAWRVRAHGAAGACRGAAG